MKPRKSMKACRWLLKDFPGFDLERFMIFHQLDKEAASLIQRDNCFVYACQMAGLSDALLNDLRYSIQKRSLSHQDVHELAKRHDLKLHIKEPSRSYYINPTGNKEIRRVYISKAGNIEQCRNASQYFRVG